MINLIQAITSLYMAAPSYAEASKYSIEGLLDAIAYVESGNDPNAWNEKEDAVGLYQIRKIFVDDVNRILGKPVFSYNDRWNPHKSREMAYIYICYWAKKAKGNKIEAMARIFNGGPKGWKKKCTKPYWKKVKAELEKASKGKSRPTE